MGQILYNYPAMLATAGEMQGQAAALTAMGGTVQSEQAALGSAWQGPTGMTYQAWQVQWNQAMEELVRSYRAMAGTHESNTMSMQARLNGRRFSVPAASPCTTTA